MFPYILKIGAFELRVYSLMLALALIVGLFFISKRAAQLKLNPKKLENAVITAFITGIIGARLYYVIFNWDWFLSRPYDIIAVWKGGLAIHGGIIGAFIGLAVYTKKYSLSLTKLLDITAPFLLLGQAIGRFGNFANGEAHGFPTITPPEIIFRIKPAFNSFWNSILESEGIKNTPTALTEFYNKIAEHPQKVLFEGKEYILKEYVNWGVCFTDKYNAIAYHEFGSMPLHPTFFYEMILNLIGAVVLIKLWKKDSNIGSGKIFGLYCIFYGIIRAVVTFFRADDLMFGFLRAPHIASIILITIGILWIKIISKKRFVC